MSQHLNQKNTESFYITKSYTNAQGKSTSTTIKKLGTLAELSKRLGTDRDGVMAWAKEQARIETENIKRNRRCCCHDPFSFQQAPGLQQKKTFYRWISFPSVYYYGLKMILYAGRFVPATNMSMI